MEDTNIDFVLIWVDGNDKKWQSERNKYAGKNSEDLADYRFRDWENLKYWFRGVEKFAPWVNNIYFITCGQCPSWLNLEHPKLKFLKHDDYIPSEYLPTFNSHTIELNLNRISGLSENFVYFNDDTFLINDVRKSDFFIDGKPRYIAALEAIAMLNDTFAHILLNDTQILNKYFRIKDVISQNKAKWFYGGYGIKNLVKTLFLSRYCCFTSLYNSHLPNPILKSTIDELWSKEFEKLDLTSKCKFRNETNVNQYIFEWWEIANGNFVPQEKNIGQFYRIGSNNENIVNDIKKQRYKMICLNDVSNDFEFEKAKKEINDSFEKILPDKSKFEI